MHWCENLLIVVPRNADHMSKALVPFIEKARFQLEDAVEEWSRIRIPESVSLRADGDLAYMCRGYQEEDLTFQEWFDRYGKRPLIFQAFLPQPPGLKKQAEERWRKTHWGTISEANYWQGQAKQGFQFRLTFPEPRPAEGYLQYFFASAGGPPLPVIRAVCEQHPDLGFIYLHEPRPGQLLGLLREPGGGEPIDLSPQAATEAIAVDEETLWPAPVLAWRGCGGDRAGQQFLERSGEVIPSRSEQVAGRSPSSPDRL